MKTESTAHTRAAAISHCLRLDRNSNSGVLRDITHAELRVLRQVL